MTAIANSAPSSERTERSTYRRYLISAHSRSGWLGGRSERFESGEIVKFTAKAAVAVAALGAASLVAACSSGSGGTSTTDLSVVPPSHSASTSAPASPTGSKTPPDATITTPVQIVAGRAQKPVSVKPSAPFPAATHSTPAPPASTTPLPTPTGPVTYVSWAFVRPYNCREHADLVDTAADVSTALHITVLLRGVPASSLSIVAPNRAVRTLPNTSSLVSSVPVGHGLYEATYTTYVSLFHPKFTPVTFSSLTALAGGTQYTIALPSPVTVTLDDCRT